MIKLLIYSGFFIFGFLTFILSFDRVQNFYFKTRFRAYVAVSLPVIYLVFLILLLSPLGASSYTCYGEERYTKSIEAYSRTLKATGQGIRVINADKNVGVVVFITKDSNLLLEFLGDYYRYKVDSSRPQLFREGEIFTYYENPTVDGNFIRFSGKTLVIFGREEVVTMSCRGG